MESAITQELIEIGNEPASLRIFLEEIRGRKLDDLKTLFLTEQAFEDALKQMLRLDLRCPPMFRVPPEFGGLNGMKGECRYLSVSLPLVSDAGLKLTLGAFATRHIASLAVVTYAGANLVEERGNDRFEFSYDNQTVILDSRLPFIDFGYPLFLSDKFSLYPALVEKGLAAIFGSYEALRNRAFPLKSSKAKTVVFSTDQVFSHWSQLRQQHPKALLFAVQAKGGRNPNGYLAHAAYPVAILEDGSCCLVSNPYSNEWNERNLSFSEMGRTFPTLTALLPNN